MTYVKPGRAAAAEMSLGTRAALAGVGLCSTCRHPVRLHGDLGCAKGECECGSTGADLRAGVATVPARTVPPSAAELAHLDVVCTCEHRRTEHTVTGSHVQCKVCRCGGFTPGGPDAPVAPPSKPTPSPVAAAPAPAVAPAAPAGPVGDPPAPRPVAAEPPPWLPGTGVPYVKPTPAPPVAATPDVDVARQVDAIVVAGKLAARKRPRLQTARPAVPTAHGSRAVVGEPDAVEEVAAVPPPAATVEPVDAPADGWFRWGPLPAEVVVTPGPLDLTPFLSAALYYYPAWFCKGCLQRRQNPGVHCRRPLTPAYVVIAPREIP